MRGSGRISWRGRWSDISHMLQATRRRSNRMKERAILLLAIAAIGLATGAYAQRTSAEPKPCPTPRPGLECPDVYRRAPVCGIKADGSKVTYSDYCQACSLQDVRSYTLGACEGSKDR